MNYKKIFTIVALIISASLSSCVSATSTDPIGDGFTSAGNAIGQVVNGITGQQQAVAQ